MTFDLAQELADFHAGYPDATQNVDTFRALLAGLDADPYGRTGQHGHFTGSALVLSRDGERTLLTRHRKLGLWLQPGGHADGDPDLRGVALREANEETGVQGLVIEPAILDLDRHWIPEHRGVAGHWHYDLRFVVHATAGEDFVVSDESDELAWWPLAEVARAPFEPSLQRIARRVLERRR